MNREIPLGRAIIDIEGCKLTPAEEQRLVHPQVGGVILFSRNFESIAQLLALTASIHALRTPALLIAVDHEGGRVQRFRKGFTQIPPMRALGRLWDKDEDQALVAARACGLVLAAELKACGVDLSFAPVLDLDIGTSGVIGDRAFHGTPDIVAALAVALQQGLADGGLAACGKHFPGHGHVAADSHREIPIDERSLAEIEATDLVPFRRLAAAGLAAVMPAHVIYPAVDHRPAGFSPVWHKYLRERCHFGGIVFSDDLSMEGAKGAGGPVARGLAALDAGCDMVLLCNAPGAADELLAGLAKERVGPVPLTRITRLTLQSGGKKLDELRQSVKYAQAERAISTLV